MAATWVMLLYTVLLRVVTGSLLEAMEISMTDPFTVGPAQGAPNHTDF